MVGVVQVLNCCSQDRIFQKLVNSDLGLIESYPKSKFSFIQMFFTAFGSRAPGVV